jgi:hypothetical protein
MGFDILRWPPADFEATDHELVAAVQPFTLTSADRIVALSRAVEYIGRRGIKGAIVECGVWRGGSMMAVALTLMRLRQTERELFLFDTYEGMSEPTPSDVTTTSSTPAVALLGSGGDRERNPAWAYASLDEVKANLMATGYPVQKVHFIKGKVEETLPTLAPPKIAILRLDTDWYESTKHELEHLYPRLALGGVLILDDYGFWEGARRATDEFFARPEAKVLLLNRIDSTGRIAVKH